MLYSIESTQPFLFVEAVQVRPVSALAQRDPEYGGLLDVRLDVFGALPRKKGMTAAMARVLQDCPLGRWPWPGRGVRDPGASSTGYLLVTSVDTSPICPAPR